MSSIKSYSEMLTFSSFEDRLQYLQITAPVGESTFGYDRYLNQMLYTSRGWNEVREKAILRDEACDLAVPDRPIFKRVFIHHINPITVEDILTRSSRVFDLENLVTVSYDTHQAIHFSKDIDFLVNPVVVRSKNDTIPWR